MDSNVGHSEVLINIAFSCDFAQIVETDTRICATSSDVLNLLFENSAMKCTSLDIMSGLSDHKLVFATFSFVNVLISKKYLSL